MNHENKSYNFIWEGLGNIDEGRKNLGENMPVLIYRLFQYTLKDILAREYDEETIGLHYRAAGYLAGKEFAKNMLDISGDFDAFIADMANKLQKLKMGILHMEKEDSISFILALSEDIDCSGRDISGEMVCGYYEGLIGGIFEAYSNKPFTVKKISCRSTGDGACRFRVMEQQEGEKV
ncbi:MAG: 4-vinyl reductase [Lachnospiraceae bacterium]|nr:4-vinyl reductase [Lachnospiraceae bacterium]